MDYDKLVVITSAYECFPWSKNTLIIYREGYLIQRLTLGMYTWCYLLHYRQQNQDHYGRTNSRWGDNRIHHPLVVVPRHLALQWHYWWILMASSLELWWHHKWMWTLFGSYLPKFELGSLFNKVLWVRFSKFK